MADNELTPEQARLFESLCVWYRSPGGELTNEQSARLRLVAIRDRPAPGQKSPEAPKIDSLAIGRQIIERIDRNGYGWHIDLRGNVGSDGSMMAPDAQSPVYWRKDQDCVLDAPLGELLHLVANYPNASYVRDALRERYGVFVPLSNETKRRLRERQIMRKLQGMTTEPGATGTKSLGEKLDAAAVIMPRSA
jgi:hypothetical protein